MVDLLHLTSLAPFQDCKEFQGELFGICNLFRDLSNKLFTSEIIELHEKQGDQHGHSLVTKHRLTEPGNNFVSLKEEGVKYSSDLETRVCNDFVTDEASKPVLEDMGMQIFFFVICIFCSITVPFFKVLILFLFSLEIFIFFYVNRTSCFSSSKTPDIGYQLLFSSDFSESDFSFSGNSILNLKLIFFQIAPKVTKPTILYPKLPISFNFHPFSTIIHRSDYLILSQLI